MRRVRYPRAEAHCSRTCRAATLSGANCRTLCNPTRLKAATISGGTEHRISCRPRVLKSRLRMIKPQIVTDDMVSTRVKSTITWRRILGVVNLAAVSSSPLRSGSWGRVMSRVSSDTL